MSDAARTVASEWGKTWSVRSPWACLAGTAALVAVTALSLANDFVHGTTIGEQPPGALMPLAEAVGPALQLGQLIFAAFALQLITAEYSTGAIRATLQAQPRRHLVLIAKALIAGVCGALAGAVLGAAAAWGSDLVLGPHAASGGVTTAGLTVRSAALLSLVAVLVVGLGAALRSAVGTLAAASALLLATLALPSRIGEWFPGQAGASLLSDPSAAATGQALVVLAVWTAAVFTLGLWIMKRRDA